ncbi:MAG: response regulator [Clostridia bacterium]|nr:response regulator [Clostridia bacterium]
MTAICVDDEVLILQLTMSMCSELSEITNVEGFSNSGAVLEWLQTHQPDIALLDIDMPGMNGLMLAKEIKEMYPDTAILFLTGYPQYAMEAFSVHATGYLLKPVEKERLAAEVSYALSGRIRKREPAHIEVHTFGGFEVYVDGRKIVFKRSKSKELLAYLIDWEGQSVKRASAFTALWEDAPYDRPMQKQMDVVIRSLKGTLEEYGIAQILQIKGGDMWIVPDEVDCDLYRFIRGDAQAINAYHGEYMSDYSWASLTEAHLDHRQKNRSPL